MARAFIFCITLLLAACASPGPKMEAFQPGDITWPAPPLPARIALSASIRTPEDAGIRKGFWGTVWSAIVGESDVSIVRPYGVHADCRERIMVADTGRRGVHIFDRLKERYSFLAGPEDSPFLSPIGVTEDQEERLYITDSAAGIVYRCDLNDSDLKVEPFVRNGITRPTGIAYNPVNRLIYVADTEGSAIHAFDGSGREVFRFGNAGTGPGLFNRPTDLTVDPQGRIIITDSLNSRIQVFSMNGAYLRGFGEPGDSPGQFAKPKGVAVDSDGHIYVCDALFDGVQMFNTDGRLLLTFGNMGSAPGEFWMPSGIFIDNNDIIYVADTYNQRIQVFTYLWLTEPGIRAE